MSPTLSLQYRSELALFLLLSYLMNCNLVVLFFLALCFELAAQCPPPSDSNMICYYRYDDDGAARPSGFTYNDIWGYTDEMNREYAILGGHDSIYIFDVTDPYETEKIAVDAPGGSSSWRDFKTFGHYLYAVADVGTEGLRVYDLDSLPKGKLHLVGAYNGEFLRAHNIFIEDESARLYVAGSNVDAAREGLLVYDLSSDLLSRSPGLLKSFQFDTLISNPGLNTYVHDLFVKNDTAYCSHGFQGYYIWDLSDLVNLDASDLVGFMENGATSNGYVHSSWNSTGGQYAYMATEVNSTPELRQIFVIDQSDKNNPVVVNTWKQPLLACAFYDNNVPHNPFVKGDTLYISYYQDGVQVLDITDPIHPKRIGYFDTEPNNASYQGTTANWGIYPFFPSGTIVASDTKNGLFVLGLGCPVDLTIVDEVIMQDEVLIASGRINLDNVQVAQGSSLVVKAPAVELLPSSETSSGGQLTILNQNGCTNH